MVEWRDKVDEEIQCNLEAVSRLTGSSSGGIIAAVHVYDVRNYVYVNCNTFHNNMQII